MSRHIPLPSRLCLRATVEQMGEALRHALLCLPFLCPPGPIPIGFSWYCEVGCGYMNYRLDAEQCLGETSVLVVRRKEASTLIGRQKRGNAQRCRKGSP